MFHVLLLSFFCSLTVAEASKCGVEAIYQLGDSISDTGNYVRRYSASESVSSRPPYGDTTNSITGRYSDGLLIIDFLAMALALPFLKPYLQINASFDHGSNFAMAGATALNISFFTSRNIRVSDDSSLNVQLEWFKAHVAKCKGRLRKALIMMGEIGGNDYNDALLQGRDMQEVQTYVASVVEAIADAVREVIGMGARRIVVPGNFPIGCFPAYLTAFQSNDSRDYDEMGCLVRYNQLSMLHNHRLQTALSSLRIVYPHVTIVYGDYYAAFQSVLRRGSCFGFEQKSLLRACCGIGGSYNYDANSRCGKLGANFRVCPNPTQYISWDGLHLTQDAYRYISQFLISSIFPQIHCTCLRPGTPPAYRMTT